MSRGHITRASRRYPSIQRQAARYGRTVRVRRAAGLPPHLLPGVTQRGKKNGFGLWRFLLGGAVLGSLALLVAAVAFVLSTLSSVGGTVAAYREVNKTLPNAAQTVVDTFQSSKILARDGTVLQEIDDPTLSGWRTFVPYEQISQYVVDATIAAEDATFWHHRGVEPVAMARGVFITATGAGSSGGSTITQQLVRGLFPEAVKFDVAAELPVERKVREALAAVALERQYSKHDIMTMYLNEIFYGNNSYGIEAAANTYFNKRANELTLGEASMLAGLPQLPSLYDPSVPDNFPRAKQRQEYVLTQMVKYRYITEEDAKAAFAQPLQPQSRSNAVLHAPHFVEYVKNYVATMYGDQALFRGGLTITTSIDVKLQDHVQKIVKEEVAELEVYNAGNGAMIVMLPWSGEIVAMVGSADFEDASIDGQVNVATAERQPGSSIKPIVYAAAFEKGWNSGTVIMDEPYRIETPLGDEAFYEPKNYSGRNYGPVSVRTSLSNSLNIPAVKALKFAGIDPFLNLTDRMGIKTGLKDRDRYGLALSLGGGEVQLLELTNAYATFANNGKYVPANPILKIQDSQGNVVYDIDRAKTLERAQQVLRAEHASQISSILTDNRARMMIFGPGNLFETTATQLKRPTAAKSGTTNDWKDNWTMGYTTDLVVGVWVGNSNNDPLSEIDGIQGAGPIWSRTMIELHEKPEFAALLRGPTGQELPKDFPRPPSIQEPRACGATSTTGAQTTPTPTTQSRTPSYCARPAA